MKEYTIKRFNNEWAKIDTLDVDNILWTDDFGIRMMAQIAYDDEKFYVHQIAKEDYIRNEITDKLGSVCRDSCMEFYFQPANEKRYFHFEINFNCVFYIGIMTERKNDTRLIRKDMSLFNAHTNKTEDGWEVYYEIPFSFLQVFTPDFKPKSGDNLRGNVYKCGDDTIHPHWMSWNKVETPTPDFCREEYFGLMHFE